MFTLRLFWNAIWTTGLVLAMVCHQAKGQGPNASPATLVIAAQNSLEQRRADYVCDGTDDQEQLKQALLDIVAFPNPGGKIVLLEGKYSWFDGVEDNLNSPKLIDDVCIEGMGRNTEIVLRKSRTPFRFRNISSASVKSMRMHLDLGNQHVAPVFEVTAQARGERSWHNTVEDIEIVNNDDDTQLAKCTGIRLYASQDEPPVDIKKNPNLFRNVFRNVSMRNVGNAVVIETGCYDELKRGPWMGGNRFEHITVWRFTHGIQFIQPKNSKGSGSNLFTDIQLQPKLDSERTFHILGGRNTFLGCVVYDWGHVWKQQDKVDPQAPKKPAWVVGCNAEGTYIQTTIPIDVSKGDYIVWDDAQHTKIIAHDKVMIGDLLESKDALIQRNLQVGGQIKGARTDQELQILGNDTPRDGPAVMLFGNQSAKPGAVKIVAGDGDGNGKGIIFQDYDPADGFTTNMVVRNDGNVGIGISIPNARLHVLGNQVVEGKIGVGFKPNDRAQLDGRLTNVLTVRNGAGAAIADQWMERSSRRWKEDIQPIDKALEKVLQLRGISYRSRADGCPNIGLVAEEVGEVIPEIVEYEENGSDAKAVSYARLVALLIEAIKEQQQAIELLKNKHVLGS